MAVRERERRRQNLLAIEIDFRDQKKRRVIEVAQFLPMDAAGKVNAKDRARALKDAAELLAQRKTDVRRGVYVHPADKRAADAAAKAERAALALTFAEFGERFLRDYAATKRSSFYDGRVKALSRVFGNRPIREIVQAELDQYIVQRLRVVKSSTVRREAAVLSKMFRMARRWGVIEQSPAEDMERPKEPPHKTRFLTRDEWDRLDANAPAWLRPFLRMAVYTGLRMKEVCELTWADWDQKRQTISLSGDNKTQSIRTVPLNVNAQELLAELKRARTERARDGQPLEPRIFVGPTGKPLLNDAERNKYLTKPTRAAMRGAGVLDASYHSLRHTFGTWTYLQTRDALATQKLLGHSTPLMTQRYINIVPEDLRAAVLALDATLAARGTGLDSISNGTEVNASASAPK